MKFDDLDLDGQLLDAIYYMGFRDATPIQEQAIPIILSGKDLIGCAQTGTGKTAAFLLPVLDSLLYNESKNVKALIIVPTRELALQIDQQVEGISYGTGLTSLALYGGGDGIDWATQKEALTKGVDLVIATPGKLISHLNLGYVNFKDITHLVMDEADRMLDIGFHDDIMKILSYLPDKRQNLMFSATMPPKIKKFAKEILNEPEEISIAISKPAEGVLQAAYLVYDDQKTDLINHLLSDKNKYKSIIIFSSTKRNVSEIVRSLRRTGYKVKGISSNLEQEERESILSEFKARQFQILVGTDVISRGIDIKDINLVINYSVPKDAEDYVHRIGRTARADTTGVALTLVNPPEMKYLARIEELIEKEIFKMNPPEELGPGPKWKVSKGGGKNRRKKPFNKRRRR